MTPALPSSYRPIAPALPRATVHVVKPVLERHGIQLSSDASPSIDTPRAADAAPSGHRRPPVKDALYFERNLQALASGMDADVRIAALSYLDIALATEARGLCTPPTRGQRLRRRWLTLRTPCGTRPALLKQCFAQGLRSGAEATLRYYGIAPDDVGLPSPAGALPLPPAVICARSVGALERARPAMARMAFAGTTLPPGASLPSCACRAAYDSATAVLTVYIDWFNGPDESSGVHHCVPLLAATRLRGRHRFRFAEAGVNLLPTTHEARGYAPFRYNAQRILEPLSPTGGETPS